MDRPWLHDALVQQQLDEVERAIQSAVVVDLHSETLHFQLSSRRAKRLRASLLLLVGRFGRAQAAEELIRAAAAIELVHEGTLYHDDIVDRAGQRRGSRSVQRAFGREAAALGGSQLLYTAAKLCAGLSTTVYAEFSSAAVRLCRGQMRELESTGDTTVEVRRRCEIMLEKTASLFVLAARVGASIADVPRTVSRALGRYALRLGMAYQLADDLRDLSSADPFEREPWADIRTQICTLPMLFALQSRSEDVTRLEAMLRGLRSGDSGAAWIAREVVRLGGASRATGVLDKWGRGAERELRDLDPSPARSSLRALVRFTAENELSVSPAPATSAPISYNRS